MEFTVDLFVSGERKDSFPAPSWRDTAEVERAIQEAGFMVTDDPPSIGFRVRFTPAQPGRSGPPAYYYLPGATRITDVLVALRGIGVRA